ncbi:MAG: hypothetical protein ACRDFT_08195 [bacterium]
MTGPGHAVRYSTRIGAVIALAVAGLFFAAARATGAPPVAQYGGAVWVFALSVLVVLPLLTPVIRNRAAARQSGGEV